MARGDIDAILSTDQTREIPFDSRRELADWMVTWTRRMMPQLQVTSGSATARLADIIAKLSFHPTLSSADLMNHAHFFRQQWFESVEQHGITFSQAIKFADHVRTVLSSPSHLARSWMETPLPIDGSVWSREDAFPEKQSGFASIVHSAADRLARSAAARAERQRREEQEKLGSELDRAVAELLMIEAGAGTW